MGRSCGAAPTCSQYHVMWLPLKMRATFQLHCTALRPPDSAEPSLPSVACIALRKHLLAASALLGIEAPSQTLLTHNSLPFFLLPMCCADPATPQIFFSDFNSAWPKEYRNASTYPTPEQCCEWCRNSWDCAYWVHQSYDPSTVRICMVAGQALAGITLFPSMRRCHCHECLAPAPSACT